MLTVIWRRPPGDPEQCAGQRERHNGHPVGAHVLRLHHQVHAAAKDRPWGAERWHRVRFHTDGKFHLQTFRNVAQDELDAADNEKRIGIAILSFIRFSKPNLDKSWQSLTIIECNCLIPSQSLSPSASSRLLSISLWRMHTGQSGCLLRRWWKRWLILVCTVFVIPAQRSMNWMKRRWRQKRLCMISCLCLSCGAWRCWTEVTSNLAQPCPSKSNLAKPSLSKSNLYRINQRCKCEWHINKDVQDVWLTLLTWHNLTWPNCTNQI